MSATAPDVKPSKLWIMLPAFNEAESIAMLLSKMRDALDRQGIPWRVVVIDDGSLDATATVLRECQMKYPFDVITHSLNRGLGETERDGFEYIAAHSSDDDVLIRMDCDDTHEPEYIPVLLRRLSEGYDVVNTSRFQRSGGQIGVDGYRAAISYGANLFMKLLFWIPGVRDYSCGYRAYRCRVIRDAVRVFGNGFIQLRGLGFTSTLETIVKLHLLGCRFAEVPFVLRYDQKLSSSKMLTSLTTMGYVAMATMYHWPFGGWRRQYRGLASAYREDRKTAVDRFHWTSFRRGLAQRPII